MNIDELIAIDVHTHAEEPCGCQRDDGYHEFQAGMARYFRNPAGAQGMLPTVQETATYYRERKIGCVIFPVDAERETGFRRYDNEEVAKIAAENSDIMIPFASIDPAKGKTGRARRGVLFANSGSRDSNSTQRCKAFIPTIAWHIRFTKPFRKKVRLPFSTRPDGRWSRPARRDEHAPEIFKPHSPR